MTALTYPLLTREERETALDAISAHFTEVIADAETARDWNLRERLMVEAACWAVDHQLTPDRIRAILAWVRDDERAAVERYLDGGLW